MAKLFGANNPKELRLKLGALMKEISQQEREEMRFLLHAEAISRGMGRYSIAARRMSGL